MEKFCYVILKNNCSTNNECFEYSDYHDTFHDYKPLTLKNIVDNGKIQRRYVPGFLGLAKTTYVKVYDEFPVICENRGNCLVDIITNKAFPIYSEGVISPNVVLSNFGPISASTVAELLKSLSPEDISRYKVAITKMEELVRYEYQRYNNLVNQESVKENNSLEYIKKFRDTYNQK